MSVVDPAVGTAVGGIVGAIAAKHQQERQHQYDMEMMQANEELYQKHFEQNKEYEQFQWDRNNAYNSPLAQVKRLGEAGINPMLAVGGMQNIASATSAIAPQSGTGTNTTSQVDIGSISQFMSVVQQLKNMRAEERKTDADATAQEIENNKQMELITSGIWRTLQENQVELSNQQIDLNEYQLQKQAIEFTYFRDNLKEQLQSYILQNENLRKDLETKDLNLRLTNEAIQKIQKEIMILGKQYGLLELQQNRFIKENLHLDRMWKEQERQAVLSNDVNEYGFNVVKATDEMIEKITMSLFDNISEFKVFKSIGLGKPLFNALRQLVNVIVKRKNAPNWNNIPIEVHPYTE